MLIFQLFVIYQVVFPAFGGKKHNYIYKLQRSYQVKNNKQHDTAVTTSYADCSDISSETYSVMDLGCWEDRANPRPIPELEGHWEAERFLDAFYSDRTNAYEKCLKATLYLGKTSQFSLGFRLFKHLDWHGERGLGNFDRLLHYLKSNSYSKSKRLRQS